MREVIRIDEPKKEAEKPVKFTHFLNSYNGWSEATSQPSEFEKVVYLGRCKFDGDMFAAYVEGTIGIYKGHINSGKY